MSKAFTKESDNDDEPEDSKPVDSLSINDINYVTPTGFSELQDEYRYLLNDERPKIVAIVTWAAKNGDRSENGDYIYNKRRLREIDRRVRYLTKRLENAKVIDPNLQKNLTKVFFGATVTYSNHAGKENTVKIVGIDEADISKNLISWISPLAKALLKSEVGDTVTLKALNGSEQLQVLAIKFV